MKKTLMFATAASLALASCSETELVDSLAQTPDYNNPAKIGFNSNTTRAAVGNLATIKESATGFQVFGYAKDADDWYNDGADPAGVTINGENNYFWGKNNWAWDDVATKGMAVAEAPSWPGEGSYPMTFFGLFPPMESFKPANVAAVKAQVITVNTDIAEQVDMMSAWNQAVDQAPTSGKLDLDFKHILSKVNVSVQVNEGHTVEVVKAQVVNIRNNRKYDYSQPSTEAWAADFVGQGSDDEVRDSYLYMTGLKQIAGIDASVSETLRANDNGNIMPIPQQLVPVVATEREDIDTDYITDNAVTMDDGAYIEVIYRMYSEEGDLFKTGMSNSNDHCYLTTDEESKVTPHKDWKLYGTYDGAEEVVTPTSESKLYIKAYYPIDSNWEMSNGYVYELAMRNSGSGYYVDDTYYDENGNDTNLPIDTDGEGPVDPIIPTDPVSQNKIHFNVSVSGWTDNSETAL